MSNNVTVVGDGGPCGTYALGIRASKPICEIALGTQKIYAKIDLKGQLVYLGAARAMKGACRLDQRLHRHATRTASEPPKPPKPPHPIREAVRPTFFEDDGWKHLLAGGKHLKWEIDWCLDHAHVVLQRITALQHPKELAIEHSLGIRLDGDLQTHIIKRGLGAQNWKDGFDHLLGVTADDVWWRLLSVRMEALACEQPAGAQVTKLVESYLRGRYCLKRICKLTPKRIQLAKFSGHRVVDELVVVLQEIAGQRPSKLERMKRTQERKNARGEGSGIIRLYQFPQVSEDLFLTDAAFARAIEIPDPQRDVDKPFLLAIEGVHRIEGRGTVVTGKIEQGQIRAGEKVEILGLTEPIRTVCTSVEMFHRVLDVGVAGQNVGLLLRGVRHDQVFRGQVVAAPRSIEPLTRFEAEVYALTKEEGGRHTPFFNGYQPQFYFRTTDVTGQVQLLGNAEMCLPGDTVPISVGLDKPIAVAPGTRFAIREGGRTVGSGIVTDVA